MKKFIFVPIFVLLFCMMLFASQAQVERVAKEVLSAYQTKNADMLKKNVSGLLKFIINEDYFNDSDVKKSMEPVMKWDGKIKEIRYDSENIMGNFVVVAVVYYSDHSKEEINTVELSTTDSKNWVCLGEGLGRWKKADFDRLDFSVPQAPSKAAKTTKTVKSTVKMDIELASGDEFKNINEVKLVECFNSIDDDNFYMILSNKDDFIQAAYSDGNYVVQYMVAGAHYEACEVLSKEKTLSILKQYLLEEPAWREGVEWVSLK